MWIGDDVTIDEFITELELTPRAWILSPSTFYDPGAKIRLRGVPQPDGCVSSTCPIAAVLGQVGVSPRGSKLSDVDRRRVILAADDVPGHDAELRRELMAACGLEAT